MPVYITDEVLAEFRAARLAAAAPPVGVVVTFGPDLAEK
jgi:hypothetical protein